MVKKYLHCEMAGRSKYKLQQPVNRIMTVSLLNFAVQLILFYILGAGGGGWG